MDSLQCLLDIEAIKRLKARYFRCVDTKDWDGWLGVFTDDVTMEFSVAIAEGASGPIYTKLESKKVIADFVVPYCTKAQTVHHGHTPEIDILSDTEARGIWAMEDIVDHIDRVNHGFGHYYETYRKVNGEWLISTTRLTRIRISQISRDHVTI